MANTAENSTADHARDPDAVLELVRLELVAAKEELTRGRQRVTDLEQRIAAIEAQAVQLGREVGTKGYAVSRWHRQGRQGLQGVVIHEDFDDPLPEFDEG